MHINGLPVRYVGQIHAANYATHTEYFLSLEHARQHLEDLYCSTDGDSIVLWPVKSWESEGEVFGHTHDMMTATHRVSFGPRGAVKVERY